MTRARDGSPAPVARVGPLGQPTRADRRSSWTAIRTRLPRSHPRSAPTKPGTATRAQGVHVAAAITSRCAPAVLPRPIPPAARSAGPGKDGRCAPATPARVTEATKPTLGGLPQRSDLAHAPQPVQRPRLDLAHALGRDPELAADLAQRRGLAALRGRSAARAPSRSRSGSSAIARRTASSRSEMWTMSSGPGPSAGSRSPNAASSPSPSGRSSDVTARAASRSARRSATRHLGARRPARPRSAAGRA